MRHTFPAHTARHDSVLILFCSIFISTLIFAAAATADTPLDELKTWLAQPREVRKQFDAQPFALQPLTRQQAQDATLLLWNDYIADIKANRQKEWDDKAITIGDHTLRLKEKHVGNRPKDGWNLFISMHGGGNADPSVNDQQWENQIRLYAPANSLYIAPRAPTNTWNLWHENHIDGLFERLIQDAIVFDGVDPNHVYLMGYSAGGDGVYQLAPRMADELAAASMMAGHPNDASPLGLRNLPFTIHVGALDGGAQGYHRNEKATEWNGLLDQLQKEDPKGYIHEVKLHDGLGHWMNREDAVAVDWMEKFTRDPIPTKLVWKQGNKTHDRFYWLAVSTEIAKKGQLIVATRDGQEINIEKAEGVSTVTVMLNDAMLDMDKPIHIQLPGGKKMTANITRTLSVIHSTLAERGDPNMVFFGNLIVHIAN